MAREVHLSDAIRLFNPLAQYSVSSDDYSTLEWLCDAPKPTEAELKALLPAAQKALEDELKDLENAKLAAQSKLAALGLNADDLKALGL
jgi:hypothetical protein